MTATDPPDAIPDAIRDAIPDAARDVMATADADVAMAIDNAAESSGFSGVARVDLPDGAVVERAYGWADRRWRVPFEVTTRAAIASGTKGFTALAAMSLVETGELRLDTTARSLLGGDLASVDDRVTVADLLAHRSGIGDYLDESVLGDISEHVLAVPVHLLDSAEAYLAILDGHRQVSVPGERFAYNNGGYVLLALLVERAAGASFAEVLTQRVIGPAGLVDTAFVRSDSLPPDVATGYVDDRLRTNALHMPLLGVGDGGLTSSVADMRRFWVALFGGAIVSEPTLVTMLTPISDVPDETARYGLGFWLHASGPAVRLEGYDAGISFRSWHDPTSDLTHTVIANTSPGAWPITRAISAVVGP